MMSEVNLCRVEELLLGIALQTRPALTKGDSVVLSVDWGHLSSVVAACPNGALERSAAAAGGPWPPVATDRKVVTDPLAIRFQNVAGACPR
jgi:hypothetical protein